MNIRGRAATVMLVVVSLAGCAGVAMDEASSGRQEVITLGEVNGYCHKKIEPIGPTDLLRRTMGGGDFIDYSGPCDGPSLADQVKKQRRFEQFRFGKEYMDEG